MVRVPEFTKKTKTIQERLSAWKGPPADSAQEVRRRRQEQECSCIHCMVERGEVKIAYDFGSDAGDALLMTLLRADQMRDPEEQFQNIISQMQRDICRILMKDLENISGPDDAA